jgi:catechol 2,3-dioxygenase-like lactoylglutathione lyase family enzyme
MADATDRRVDIGLVIRDSATSLRFYRDTLGLEDTGDLEFPHAVMHRLRWGASLVKLTRPRDLPAATNPPGGQQTATGLRYLTLTVPDLDGLVERCVAAGYAVRVPPTEVRPGIVIAFVEDPDGNWVEFLQS